MTKTETLPTVLHVYIVAYKNNHLLSTPCLEKTFISTGFSNWKDATANFAKHEGSRCHKDSVLKTITLPGTTSDVGEMLLSQLAKERLFFEVAVERSLVLKARPCLSR